MTHEDLFNVWLDYLKQDEDLRYSKDARREHFEQLAQIFIRHHIKLSDLKDCRAKAMEALTTLEGRKGKDKKYKTWKANCLSDFDTIVADTYYQNNMYEDIDSDIIKWVDKKFNGNEDILLSAHQAGNIYNLLFLQENFDME